MRYPQPKERGSLAVDLNENGIVDDLFIAGRGDTAATLETIKRYKDEYGYVLDPHTAVGVLVAERFKSAEMPTICLATAHPAKFTQAIVDATGDGQVDFYDVSDALASTANYLRRKGWKKRKEIFF